MKDRFTLIVISNLMLVYFFFYLCSVGSTVVEAELCGNIIALDKNLAHQEILVNGSNIEVKKPEHLPYVESYLPLHQTNLLVTKDNLTFTIANNAVVVINHTNNGFSYKPYFLDCTPLLLAGPTPLGIIYGMCPNRLFAVNYTSINSKPSYISLRLQQTINGTLLIGPAPNYSPHYLTGNNGDLVIYNTYSGISTPVPVPLCVHVSNIKSDDLYNYFAILCSSNISNPFNVTFVHLRNLTVNHYVSVNLSTFITRNPIIKWFDSIVLLADHGSIHAIDKISGTYKYHSVNENITDIMIVNTTLAYYVTSNIITKFSPLEILQGSSPTPQNREPACGPPWCAYTTSVTDEVILYFTSNTSFGIKKNDSIVKNVKLEIAPQLLLHNLTYHPTVYNQISPFPTPPQTKQNYMYIKIIVPILFMLIVITMPVIIIICAIFIQQKRRERTSKKQIPSPEQSMEEVTSSSCYSSEETEFSSMQEQMPHPIQESDKSVHFMGIQCTSQYNTCEL